MSRNRNRNVAKAAPLTPQAAAIAHVDGLLAKVAELEKRNDATPTAAPFAMQGVRGTAMFGRVVASRETNPKLVGLERWRTFAEIKANNDGGAGTAIRFLLGLIGKVEWRFPVVTDAASQTQAEDIAGRVQDAITCGATPWRRVVRSMASYLWDGYSLTEWSAERKRTGDIGIADLQIRGPHTIAGFIRHPRTRAITGVVQRDPETGREIPISRRKLVYLVDDALTDSPIGMGLLRQAVKTLHRLNRYEWLEGIGYETNLRGVPVVRAPLSALRKALADETITATDAAAILDPLEDIIQHHVRSQDTGYMLDSEPHRDHEGKPTGTAAYGIELLKGDASGEESLGKSIARERYAIASLFGAQVLLLDKGSLALSRQMAELAVMFAEGILADIAEATYADLVLPIGALNQWPEELLPRPVPAGLLVRDPEVLAAMLRDLATSDPHGDDPAVDEVRTSQGLSPRPVRDPEADAMLRPAPPDDDEDEDELGAAGAPDQADAADDDEEG